ncbi:galactose-3-O-sulfotransferase [Nitzschia inconspicua]|uniref:Galactose-3-O-sulfotransferase n=1 Tax=Nitzschia inconspicua TaxID=303405 RepID=A0A9K3KQQ3_9STRA|nr:galactose-3-O-sulfotransferase [Nitzschia inconspicua]
MNVGRRRRLTAGNIFHVLPRKNCRIRLILAVTVAVLFLHVVFLCENLKDNDTSYVQYIQKTSLGRNLTIDSIARIWTWTPPPPITADLYPWCRPEGSSMSLPGLMYIKIDKTSSSTLTGINIRLAHRVGARSEHGVCSHTREHYRAYTRLSADRLRQSSPPLVWTFLRDPTTRAVSHYFHFYVSRQGYGVQYGVMSSILDSLKNFQTLYVIIPPRKRGFSNPGNVLAQVMESDLSLAFLNEAVLQQYNFIGLVERFDESLAVMKILWNLDLGDLIVLSAKKSGGYDDGRFRNSCTKIVKPGDYGQNSKEFKVLQRIQQYLWTDFRSDNLDFALYQAVNKSLDKTIAELGKLRVEQTVQQLRRMRGRVETKCQSSAVFPCSQNGTQQMEKSAKNCYWYDSGCAFQCVDQVVG